MSAPTPIDVRVLRQLDENLRAARRLKAPWRVLAALIAGAAMALESLEVDDR